MARSCAPPQPGTDPALAEPGTARVDLGLNFPILPEQPALLAQSLTRLMRHEAFESALAPVGGIGTPRARAATAGLLARDGWAPDPDRILFAGNAPRGA